RRSLPRSSLFPYTTLFRSPRSLTGVELTSRGIALTSARFNLYNLSTALVRGDAEKLPFVDEVFDIVYSWGVLHHTPDTQRTIQRSEEHTSELQSRGHLVCR